MAAARILLGVVGRPHGVRGLLHVHSYTAAPEDLAGYGALQDDRGRVWHLSWRGAGVAELRDAEGRAVADRDQAAALTNLRLFVDRDRLPAPDPDEFYLADLVGLRAEQPDGAALGRVDAVHDYGAGASLEIAPQQAGQPVLLVPFTRRAVPVVDLPGGRVVVVPPAEIAEHAA